MSWTASAWSWRRSPHTSEEVGAGRGPGDTLRLARELEFAGDAPPSTIWTTTFEQGDALLTDWPEAEAIVGNPPYQSKNKRAGGNGPRLPRAARPLPPMSMARSDHCVYWFRLAHDRLEPGHRAGLVGTNTIRQNYSREASLRLHRREWRRDHEAMSSTCRGRGRKRRSGPMRLGVAWADPRSQGLPHESLRSAAGDQRGQVWKLATVLRPFMIANELIGKKNPPGRYVIDFQGLDDGSDLQVPFQQLEHGAAKAREGGRTGGEAEQAGSGQRTPRRRSIDTTLTSLRSWWTMSYPREAMVAGWPTAPLHRMRPREKRPIFAF